MIWTTPSAADAAAAAGGHRHSGWTHARALCCPQGHHIKDGWLKLGEDHIRCTFHGCDARLYVLAVSRLGLMFVAEVAHDDMRAIATHADPLETLAYLGARLWRPPATPTRGDVARGRR